VQKKPSSIIDVLHQRVIQSKKKLKAKKGTSSSNATPKGNNDDNDLLMPTPEKESEKVFGFKKNIFETFILTSRTRTENNAYKKKEILKEVFGAADERPRSAPPTSNELLAEKTQDRTLESEKKISYDQKYREYLEKMNVDFLDDKKKIDVKCDGSVKEEEDEDFDDAETIVASERDLITPTLKSGKARKNRSRRCKGSSGMS
jgi:hypothetical protein